MSLRSLKEGDKVVYKRGSYYAKDCIIFITRLTKTMIVTNEGRYNRDAGYPVGDTYDGSRIRYLNKTDMRKLEEKIERREMAEKISDLSCGKSPILNKLDKDELLSILNVFVKHI